MAGRFPDEALVAKSLEEMRVKLGLSAEEMQPAFDALREIYEARKAKRDAMLGKGVLGEARTPEARLQTDPNPWSW